MNMRHVFILNPAAGREDRTAAERAAIEAAAGRCGINAEIITTKFKGDGTETVDRIASESRELCRFYACGGDGTLNEVCAGAAGHANAQVACYPSGTGNDFIKIFTGIENFLSFDKLINGTVMGVDVMQAGTHRAVNICSAGVDSRVANWMNLHKEKLPGSGKLPYDIALLVTFFKKLPRYYEVEVDGKHYDGEYYIIVAASGRYYGGGYYAVPESEPDDGLLDFLLVKNLGRLGLIKNVGKYQAGRHSELGENALYLRGRHMVLRSRQPEPFNADGEIYAEQEVDISLLPEKLNMVIPAGSRLIRNEKARETAKT